jgi:hypothetical protein
MRRKKVSRVDLNVKRQPFVDALLTFHFQSSLISSLLAVPDLVACLRALCQQFHASIILIQHRLQRVLQSLDYEIDRL